MSNIRKSIIRMFFRSDWDVVELISATIKILWGVWLWSFNIFETSKVFSVMGQLGSERMWGSFMLLIGVCQIASIYVGREYRVYWLRRIFTLVSIAFWIFNILLFIGTNIAGIGAVISIAMIFFLGVNNFRLRTMQVMDS